MPQNRFELPAHLTLVLSLITAVISGCATTQDNPASVTNFSSWQEQQSWLIDGQLRDAALADNGSFLLISAGDQFQPSGISRLDAEAGDVTTFLPNLPPPQSVAVSPDGQTVAGSWQGFIGILDIEGTVKLEIPHKTGNQQLSFEDMEFTPDGQRLVGISSSLDWISTVTGDFLHQRAVPSGAGRHLAVLDDNTVIAEQNTEVRLVNATEAEPRCVLDVTYPDDVAFSPDGSQFAVALSRSGVLVWNTADCSVASEWSDESTASTITWLPDNRHLAAATRAGAVKFWDTKTGTVIHTLQAFDEGTVTILMTPDGQTLVTIGKQGELQAKVWRAGGS